MLVEFNRRRRCAGFAEYGLRRILPTSAMRAAATCLPVSSQLRAIRAGHFLLDPKFDDANQSGASGSMFRDLNRR